MTEVVSISQFKSLAGFIKHFSTDEQCRKYLEAVLWDNQPTCPFCGNMTNIWRFEDSIRFKCSGCKKKFKITQNTIFEGSHLPLTTWFAAIYLVTSHSKGVSSTMMAKYLNVTQKTAWFLLHRIRESVKHKPLFKNTTVEVDEVYIGGKPRKGNKREEDKKRKRGRGTDKAPVVGIVERQGFVIMAPLKNISSESIHGFIKDHVEQKTNRVITDQFLSYKGLHEFYQHDFVDHSKEYVVGDIHTNTIEGVWGLFKRVLFGIYHQVSKKHLGRYCVEFSFRYNNRKLTQESKFNALLYGVFGQRLKYNRLIGKLAVKV